MSNTPKTVAEIDALVMDCNNAKMDFLRGRGWVFSCENISSIWLWEKPIGGRIYLVDMPVALAIEEAIDEQEDDDR